MYKRGVKTKKRGYRPRKRTLVGLAILVVASLVGWLLIRPLPDPTYQVAPLATPASSVQLTWPSTGEAAIETQYISPVLDNGVTRPLPTASTAKLITSLVVLQRQPLDLGEFGPGLTLSSTDVDIYNKYVAQGGSVVRVSPGENIREYQALQALLLPSANNMADSMAAWAFGSLGDYQKAATAYVQALKLTDTVIGSDASGFAPSTTSTPHDLVLIGEQVLASPVLTQIAGQKIATIPIEGNISNVNSLLGTNGIIGLKTGNNDQDLGAFVFAAHYDVAAGQTVTLIGAVMGMPSLNAALGASVPLLKSAEANLSYGATVQAGKLVATYTTAWGAHVQAVAKQDVSAVMWRGTTLKPTVNMQTKSLDFEKGATVGNVTVNSGLKSTSSDVVLAQAIPQPSLWWRLTHF